jgi:hypothetical protein
MKVGRNDPCPCGSGQKYKKCCAAKDEAAAAAQLAADAAKAAQAEPAKDENDAAPPPEKTRKEANARTGDWHSSSKRQPQDPKAMRARRRTV